MNKLKAALSGRMKAMIVLPFFIAMMIVVLLTSRDNVKDVETQMWKDLEDVANQNARIVDTRINSQYEIIQSLTKELDDVTEENVLDKLNHFKIFMDECHFKRFAFCFADGTTYSTDGEVENLSFREFYKRGMDGKCSITGKLEDAIKDDGAPVNVMTVPVYEDDGTVKGVFGVAYETQEFDKSIQVESFDGLGYGCIVNDDYEIVAVMGNSDFSISNNMLDEVTRLNGDSKSVDNVKMLLDSDEIEHCTINLSDNNYCYSIPVSLMDSSFKWHVITIIPSEVLQQKVAPIQTNQIVMIVWNLILAVAGVLLLIMAIISEHEDDLRAVFRDPVTKDTSYAKFRIDMDKRLIKDGYLIVLDIINFNNISIVAGEDSSEKMIKATWKIIKTSLKKTENAAHVRDDMFVLHIKEDDADEVVRRIEVISKQIGSCASEYGVSGIRAGYGIFMFTGDETTQIAYSKAKIAKEYARNDSTLHYAFFKEIERVHEQREKQLEDRFESAIANEEFEVWFQPKYSAEGYKIVGSEALVRWRDMDGKMISPGEFIPLFEKNGMIAELDEYVFRMVCRQQKYWKDRGMERHPVSINISRASLYRLGVEERYNRIMEEYEIEPEYIQLEVTETVVEKRADICDLLNHLRAMGIKILMDDFGTGYSSLSTLCTECFDTLKLDKSLIDHIGEKNGETMLYHIISMGQQMGLHITAEGVEKKEQLKYLQDMHCDDIQGFYFSRPLPINEFEQLMKTA